MSFSPVFQRFVCRQGQFTQAVEHCQPALIGAGHIGIERHGDCMDDLFALNPPRSSIVKIAIKRSGFLFGICVAGIGQTERRACWFCDAGGHCAVGRIYDVAVRAFTKGPCDSAIGVFNPPVDQLPCSDKVFWFMRHGIELSRAQGGDAGQCENGWRQMRDRQGRHCLPG